MDNVKLELLITNNNEGIWEKANKEEFLLFPSLSHFFHLSICLPYVCLVFCVVLAALVLSVCSFDRWKSIPVSMQLWQHEEQEIRMRFLIWRSQTDRGTHTGSFLCFRLKFPDLIITDLSYNSFFLENLPVYDHFDDEFGGRMEPFTHIKDM